MKEKKKAENSFLGTSVQEEEANGYLTVISATIHSKSKNSAYNPKDILDIISEKYHWT